MSNEYEVCPSCGSHIPANSAVCPYCQFVIYQDDDDFVLPSLKSGNSKTSRSTNVARHAKVEEPISNTNTFSNLNFDGMEKIEVHQEPISIPVEKIEDLPTRKPKVKEEKESPFKYILLFIVLLVIFCGLGYTGVNVLMGKGIPFLSSTEKETSEPVSTPIPTIEATIEPTVEPTSEPIETQEPVQEEVTTPSTIGSVDILTDVIRVRDGAGTDYNEVGEATNGQHYDVYEQYFDGTYTWYRIGDNQWVPTDGTWMNFNPNS